MLASCMFTPAPALPIDPNQRKRLAHLVRAGTTPQKVAQRARIILLASEGMPNRAIAQAVDVSRPTVLLWRARFAAAGVPGLLRERPRPGRKPEVSPERIQEVVEATLHTTPAAPTHWTVRTIANARALGPPPSLAPRP